MKKVLIIDDSSVVRRLIKYIVTKNGYEVVGEASNGRIGLKKYKDLLPDIVTMDLVMDEMTGTETLKAIIKENPLANVIIISSMGQELIIREAISLGAKAFILKPFNENEIMNALNML